MSSPSEPSACPPPPERELPHQNGKNGSGKSHRANEEIQTKSYYWPEQTNIDLKEVERGFFSLASSQQLVVLLIPFFSLLVLVCYSQSTLISQVLAYIFDLLLWISREKSYIYYELIFFILFTTFAVWYTTKPKNIYLVDFEVWAGKQEWQISNSDFIFYQTKTGYFTKESLDFQERMSKRTGVGEGTYLPSGLKLTPPACTTAKAREEAEEVMFPILDALFASTGVSPKDIDILIVNCSLFCPTPSLASMVVNKYKMRSNIRSFNLGGMGCSAGVIAIDLAKDLLQVHKNSRALVVSTENITQNWYRGNEKGMMLQNALFRCGGAAILLSNRWKDSWVSKYQLMHTVRIHKGASDQAYNSVYQDEDPFQNKGVRLSKDLMQVVGNALQSNMTVLGPLVLPWAEQFKFIAIFIYSQICKKAGWQRPKPFVPDFRKAFQHFCIHAGGRAIIDGLEENLKLSARHVEPSRATLYRYGNTSSSSVWYELAYSERMGYIKKGDRIWQIALGSGFKCNSAVWKSLQSIEGLPNPKQQDTTIKAS